MAPQLGWNLATIRSKARAVTGRPDESMMSNDSLDEYINNFYQIVLPRELKIFWGYTYYQFFTQAGVDQYVSSADFVTINPNVTVDGFNVQWYIDPSQFWQDYPQRDDKALVATGDGVTNSFSFTFSAYPMMQRSIYVTDGTQVVVDVPATATTGTFVDYNTGAAVAGSVNYQNGTVTNLGFLVPPAANVNINASWSTYLPNRPQGILYYKTQPLVNSTSAQLNAMPMFVIRPVPDQVYLVKMQGIQVPRALTLSTDVPFRPDLGPLIAYGAALDIFANFNQMDQYQETLVEYNRYKDVCMQDTYEEYLYQRSIPRF